MGGNGEGGTAGEQEGGGGALPHGGRAVGKMERVCEREEASANLGLKTRLLLPNRKVLKKGL